MRGFGKNYSRPSDKRTARQSVLVCSLLFVIFSVVYLGVFQGDVMEALHYSFAHGKTVFALVPTALVITALLLLLRWGVNFLLKLRGRARVWAFIPSFLGLVAFTGIDRTLYRGGFVSVWWWLAPLLAVLFVCTIMFIRKEEHSSRMNAEPKGVFISDVLAMTVMGLFTVLLGNTDKVFHDELKMEHHLIHGNTSETLKVAAKSLRTSRTITALRALAMSKEGTLGEKLFKYPQYYSADGLFFGNDSLQTLRYTNDTLYNYLGDKPKDWENSESFLKRICYEETGTNKAVDYYIAALLLNKNLDGYALAMNDFFAKEDSISRYEGEALVLYKSMNPGIAGVVDADSLVYHRFKDYNVAKNKEYATEKERENRLRTDFGDTYWWYYDYQK